MLATLQIFLSLSIWVLTELLGYTGQAEGNWHALALILPAAGSLGLVMLRACVACRWYGQGAPKLVFVERKTHRESWKGEESVKERITLAENLVLPFLEGKYTIEQAQADLRAKVSPLAGMTARHLPLWPCSHLVIPDHAPSSSVFAPLQCCKQWTLLLGFL